MAEAVSGWAFTILTMVGADTTIAEWLTAGGTVFAALGTVGAVAIALWQTVRPKQAKLTVHCWYGEKREEGGRPYPTLTLSATHAWTRHPLADRIPHDRRHIGSIGRRRRGINHAACAAPPLPVGTVTWDVRLLQTMLEMMKRQGGNDTTYVSALFVDSLGRRHDAALPKIFEFRDDGWHPKYL